MCCCCSDACLDQLFVSKGYLFSIFIQVALSTGMLAYMLHNPAGYNSNKVIIVCEFTLSIMYSMDVLLRFIRHRCEYFLRFDNICDFAIYCCIQTFFVLFVIELLNPDTVKPDVKKANQSKYGPFSLIFLRYAVILARIYSIYNRARTASHQIALDAKYNNIDRQELSYNNEEGQFFYRNDDRLF